MSGVPVNTPVQEDGPYWVSTWRKWEFIRSEILRLEMDLQALDRQKEAGSLGDQTYERRSKRLKREVEQYRRILTQPIYIEERTEWHPNQLVAKDFLDAAGLIHRPALLALGYLFLYIKAAYDVGMIKMTPVSFIRWRLNEFLKIHKTSGVSNAIQALKDQEKGDELTRHVCLIGAVRMNCKQRFTAETKHRGSAIEREEMEKARKEVFEQLGPEEKAQLGIEEDAVIPIDMETSTQPDRRESTVEEGQLGVEDSYLERRELSDITSNPDLVSPSLASLYLEGSLDHRSMLHTPREGEQGPQQKDSPRVSCDEDGEDGEAEDLAISHHGNISEQLDGPSRQAAASISLNAKDRAFGQHKATDKTAGSPLPYARVGESQTFAASTPNFSLPPRPRTPSNPGPYGLPFGPSMSSQRWDMQHSPSCRIAGRMLRRNTTAGNSKRLCSTLHDIQASDTSRHGREDLVNSGRGGHMRAHTNMPSLRRQTGANSNVDRSRGKYGQNHMNQQHRHRRAQHDQQGHFARLVGQSSSRNSREGKRDNHRSPSRRNNEPLRNDVNNKERYAPGGGRSGTQNKKKRNERKDEESETFISSILKMINGSSEPSHSSGSSDNTHNRSEQQQQHAKEGNASMVAAGKKDEKKVPLPPQKLEYRSLEQIFADARADCH